MLNTLLHDVILWLRTLYDQHGYIVIFLSALSENTALLGLFLPGNSLVLLGAFYARLGSLNLGLVILWATLGTIVGYHIDYLFGRFVLSGAIMRWCKTRLGRRLRLAGRMRLARMLLARHGGKAILISHVASHLRSIVAICAGLTHMRYRTFLFFEIIAATLWNTLFALLGYFIAVEIDLLTRMFQQAGWVILVALLVFYLLWRYSRHCRRQQRTRAHRALAQRRT